MRRVWLGLVAAAGLAGLLLGGVLGAARAAAPLDRLPAGPPQPAAQTGVPGWATAVVDAEKGIGIFGDHNLAVDSAGQPHVVYGAEHLYYAWRDTVWHSDMIDPAGGVGNYASLVLDSAGQPHVSYLDGVNNAIKYAYFDGAQWNLSVVAYVPSTGQLANHQYTSLALDSAGLPHILFWTPADYSLMYASFDGAQWSVTKVAGDTYNGLGLSLALDTHNNPHLLYDNGTNFRYAFWDGSAWQFQTIGSASASGFYPALVLDGADQPHFAYEDVASQALIYTYLSGDGWLSETVDSNVGLGWVRAVIAFGPDGEPRLAYTNFNTGELTYASRQSGVWSLQAVAGDYADRFDKSLALSPTGVPHIVYRTAIGLSHAYYDGSQWLDEPIDEGRDVAGGDSFALAASAPYTPAIAYVIGNQLRYAEFDGVNWSPTVVATGTFAAETALALAPTEPFTPNLAYYDLGAKRLVHAYRQDSAWLTESVASLFNPGPGVALALAPTAPYTPLLAYVDHGQLFSAQWSGSDWGTGPIDPDAAGVGRPTLALSPVSPNTPFLAYTQINVTSQTEEIRLAQWTGSAWVTQTVSPVSLINSIALAVDHQGDPHVAYLTNGIEYAAWNGSGWVTQTVSTDNLATNFSLALDSHDQPQMVFTHWPDIYDSSDLKQLHYAVFDGSAWNVQDVAGGAFGSLALDGQDRPLIAYVDQTQGRDDLMFAVPQDSGSLPQAGGTFGVYAAANFIFPPNAFNGATRLNYLALPATAPGHVHVFYQLSGTAVNTGAPAQLAPGATYTIVVSYNDLLVPRGYSESTLALYYRAGTAWVKEPTSHVDIYANTVTARSNRLTTWALLLHPLKLSFLPLIAR